jgi:3-hydroxyacyl-[acyl-carrier-protein] dehydratase
MPPEALFDIRSVDLTRVVADQEAIRRTNPQRFEMEMLTAIVHVDRENHVVVGYKDTSPDDFWVRGHMPDFPLMPGVLICEAAAQLCGWYCRSLMTEGDFIAFGGMDEVRFRGPVYPGDRLVLAARLVKFHRRQILSQTQGFVNQAMVFQGNIIGVPFSRPQPKAQ